MFFQSERPAQAEIILCGENIILARSAHVVGALRERVRSSSEEETNDYSNKGTLFFVVDENRQSDIVDSYWPPVNNV